MTAPRQLLGWTVPEHITFSYKPGTGVGMFITCPKHAFGPLRESYLYPLEGDLRVGAFLERHAHGEPVGRVVEVLPETPEPPHEDWHPQPGERVIAKLFSRPDNDVEGEFVDHASNFVSRLNVGLPMWTPVLRATLRPVAPQSSPTPLPPLSVPVETEGGEGGDTEALRADLDNLRAELRAVTAQRNDAQRAGLKFVGQLNEIRALLPIKHIDDLNRIADIVGWPVRRAPGLAVPVEPKETNHG